MAAFGGQAIPVRVTDLRGRVSPGPIAPVLVDPTGRRARQLRLVGRMLASVLLLWLCGLVLGGVGLLPLPNVPLGQGLRVAQEPARVAPVSSDRGGPARQVMPTKLPSAVLRSIQARTARLAAQAHHTSGASALSLGAAAAEHVKGQGGASGAAGARGAGAAAHNPGHGSAAGSGSGATASTSSSSSSSSSTSSSSSSSSTSNASPQGTAHGQSAEAHAGTTSNSNGSTQGTTSSGSPHGHGPQLAPGHGVTGG